MSRRKLLGWSIMVGLVGVTVACASDDGDGNGGAPAPNVPPGAEAGADARPPPVRAEFGLDTRPLNTTCAAVARPASTGAAKFERVFANVQLGTPMMIAQAPGDGSTWYVAQRGGTLVSFAATSPANTPTTLTSLATLADPVGVQTAGEGGFLGFAFHPKFAENGRIYVSWTANNPAAGSMRSTLGYITSPDGGKTFTSYSTILFFDQNGETNHKGGGLAFGNDGFLYASFGDGGGQNDLYMSGQKTTGFFSKVLRLDVDRAEGGKAYGIPDGNPFKTSGGAPEVFAYGFRNPFRISIDRETNDLWVGDVGGGRNEEVNGKVKAGGNYGWPCREGTEPLLTDPAKCPNPSAAFVAPTFAHVRTGPDSAASISGGVVYRGTKIPSLYGAYIYGDYVTRRLWALSSDPTTGETKITRLNDAGPVDTFINFASDVDGEVYAVALSGAMYKLVPEGAQTADTFPDRLTKTGCVDPANPRLPASGLVPYGVNSPLWSDGAGKRRFIALPDTGKIKVGADGDFEFPNGTVLVKSFTIGDKLVETRLFMRHDDGGWAGYTYEWNDEQTDAVLLRGSKSKPVGSQTWYYPSRAECLTCHTEVAGRSLGLELGQQNGDFVYDSTNRVSNQLKTLEHIGLFEAPLGKPVTDIVAYPTPTGTTGSAESRARAYLHSNCSNCHQPSGPGGGDMDLRFATAFKDVKVCNVDPARGDVGITGGKLVTPGNPDTSILLLRPRSPLANRMPPLASSIVDTAGTAVLEEWIRGIAACPP